MYNDTVLDHLSDPRNIGTIDNPDGIGHVGNPADGDKITVYIKIENHRINDVKIKVFGCGAAIAAASMMSELAFGKNLEEALSITNDTVAEALGGLPEHKLLCSNIAATALHNAIADYKARIQS